MPVLAVKLAAPYRSLRYNGGGDSDGDLVMLGKRTSDDDRGG